MFTLKTEAEPILDCRITIIISTEGVGNIIVIGLLWKIDVKWAYYHSSVIFHNVSYICIFQNKQFDTISDFCVYTVHCQKETRPQKCIEVLYNLLNNNKLSVTDMTSILYIIVEGGQRSCHTSWKILFADHISQEINYVEHTSQKIWDTKWWSIIYPCYIITSRFSGVKKIL